MVMSTKKSWWWSRQRSLDGEVDKGGKELLSRSTKVHSSGSSGLWAELGLSGATLPPMMDATTPSHKSCLCPPWLHPSVKRWSNTPAHEISQILKTRPNTTQMHKKCYYTTTFFDKIQIQEEMRIQSLYNDDKNSCKMPWGHILPFASSPYQSSATQIPLHFYLAKGLNTNSVFRSFIFRSFGRKYERERKQTK